MLAHTMHEKFTTYLKKKKILLFKILEILKFIIIKDTENAHCTVITENVLKSTEMYECLTKYLVIQIRVALSGRNNRLNYSKYRLGDPYDHMPNV